MKGIILPIGGAIAAGMLGIFEIIPPFMAILVILIIIGARDFVLMALMRGLPWAMITQRIRGGIIWGVWNKGNNIKVDRFEPIAGTISTKKHGTFNIMPDRLYKIDGVPFGFAPDGVGYNVGLDHALLIKELKRRGIKQVHEVADMDEYGQFLGWKDDKRIRDLMDKFEFTPSLGEPLSMDGFNDLYRYTTEAANPYHMDARLKIGISQGLDGQLQKGTNWGLYMLGAIIAVAAVVALYIIVGGNEDIIVNVASDAANQTGPIVIPG